jgi:energy-coupling factor transporter transmembrane protein EcfT
MPSRDPQTRSLVLGPGFNFGLMSLLILACCFVDVSEPVRLLAVATICIACPIVARTEVITLLKRLLPLLSFAVLGLALVLLAPVEAGTPTLRLPVWDRPVSAQAATFLCGLAVKSTLVVLVVTAFASFIGERDVILGLRGLHVPGKVVDLTYMVLRSVGSVRDEVMRLVRARDSRGRPRGLRGIAVAGAISRVLLIRLAQRAETQAFALCARGYAGRIEITERPRVSGLEVLLLAGLAACLGWLVLAA